MAVHPRGSSYRSTAEKPALSDEERAGAFENVGLLGERFDREVQ